MSSVKDVPAKANQSLPKAYSREAGEVDGAERSKSPQSAGYIAKTPVKKTAGPPVAIVPDKGAVEASVIATRLNSESGIKGLAEEVVQRKDATFSSRVVALAEQVGKGPELQQQIRFFTVADAYKSDVLAKADAAIAGMNAEKRLAGAREAKHLQLTIASAAPFGVGTGPALADAKLYLEEGERFQAALSAATAIPFLGTVGAVGKLTVKELIAEATRLAPKAAAKAKDLGLRFGDEIEWISVSGRQEAGLWSEVLDRNGKQVSRINFGDGVLTEYAADKFKRLAAHLMSLGHLE